jgi:hypothetical protein
MAGSSRALTLKLLADIENFTKGLNSADNHVTTFGEKVADYGKKAALAFAAVGAAAIAASVDMVKNAAADEAAQRTLAKTLENTTKATKDQVAAVEDYITKTSLAKGVTDDELRPAFARITRSTKDLEESQKLLNLAMDISAATGKPLEAIANSLGKAYDGNTNALGRLGLGIDQSVLKTKDFNLVYENLRGSFKGFAEQEANTFEGKLRRLQIAFDEGKETIGSYILTAITPMVEVIVNKVIPAISDFTNNLGEKLRPVIQFLTPITDGLRKAFNTVRDSLASNSEELQPLLNLFKAIAAFARDVLAPILSKTLGKAFEIIGTAISGLIDGLAKVVTFFNNLYNAIKRVVDLSKQLGSNLNPFDNGKVSGASSPSAPTTPVTPSGIPSYLNVRPVSTTNITVNGAIDSESAARQIVQILNDSNARGTLGSAAFV